MKYLVTGASGFAGTYLIRQLKEAGHDVVGMVRRGGTLRREGVPEVIADLRNQAAVNRAVEETAPEGIFHLAAPETSVGQSWAEPETTLDANLVTTINLLGAVRRQPSSPQILFVSSSEVLGSVPEADLPADESRSVHPENPYALSKALDEEMCHFYEARFGLRIVVVRSFNYLGPGQRAQFVIPRFATEIARLEKAGGGQLAVGNLLARRDFTDVRDMVAAYTMALQQGKPGEIYHAGSGQDYSIEELLGRLLKLATATIEVVSDPALFRPTDIPVTRCDNTKLQALGWAPHIPLEQTLGDILEEARTK